MERILRYFKNRNGFSIVLLAIGLAVLLMIAGVAIDISYMYYTKNQLQVAADAAALAGAALITDTNDLTQYNVRAKAKEIAEKNNAAGIPVEIITDNSNVLSNDNDITVGNWDGSDYHSDQTPVNAIEVRPQRIAGLSGNRGHVRVFFGKIFKIFKIINSDWSFMSARARAVAARPSRATGYIALCVDGCPSGSTWPDVYTFDPPRFLENGPTEPYDNKFAWTSLLSFQTAPGFNLSQLICTISPYNAVCDYSIYTTMGGTVEPQNLEAKMYDPYYDRENKECDYQYPCPDGSKNVTGWWLTVPVTKDCPPGIQGGENEPHEVYGFAIIRVSLICEEGVGNPCHQYLDEKQKYYAPAGACDLYPNKTIIIDRISCYSCEDADDVLGRKPVLVK